MRNFGPQQDEINLQRQIISRLKKLLKTQLEYISQNTDTYHGMHQDEVALAHQGLKYLMD